jgi:hypothetical protein
MNFCSTNRPLEALNYDHTDKNFAYNIYKCDIEYFFNLLLQVKSFIS